MRGKLVKAVLAAALCLTLVMTLGAAAGRNLVEPTYDEPSNTLDSEVIVLDHAGETAVGGFIVSINESKTYVVTDAVVNGDTPYVFFDQVITDDGRINTANAHWGTVEWVDQYSRVCLISVPTTDTVLSEHTYTPIAKVSYLSDGEQVWRCYVSPENNDQLHVNWRYVTQEQTTARRDTSYISSISPNSMPGMFAITDWDDQQQAAVGGPVFNGDGVAVGMAMAWKVNDELTFRFNAALDDLIDYLYSQGIEFVSYNDEFENNAPSGGTSGGSYGGGSSGGTSGGGSSGSSSGGSSLKSDLISGAAIGLVSVAGFYGFTKLRKKKGGAGSASSAQKDTYTPTVDSYPQPQPCPELTGFALTASVGPLAGMTFPLHTGSINIGREASQCSIVYPEDTRGVSGVHCCVSYAGGIYTVTDWSKFGTYINGIKLTPGQPSAPLHPGDAIGLGSQKVIMVFTAGTA